MCKHSKLWQNIAGGGGGGGGEGKGGGGGRIASSVWYDENKFL